MLESLCGSRNVQKILLFLFVNGKCYGTQLHRMLSTSLTPLQKALLRLEKGGIITSYYEGKTRLYQFNPAYPLLGELEILLKKTYTLLSPKDKKQYVMHGQETPQKESKGVALLFWNKLATIEHLLFTTKDRWTGKGEVTVTKEGDNALIFQEKGSWKGEYGEAVDFSNTFRWTLDRPSGMISLEHLRRGVNHPVFLFHLAPTGPRKMSSVDTHLCGGDVYFGQVFFDNHGLRFNWRVIGPKKNQEMNYYYS